jgi:hypothetical protein
MSAVTEIVGIDLSQRDKFYVLAKDDRGAVRRHLPDGLALFIVRVVRVIVWGYYVAKRLGYKK